MVQEISFGTRFYPTEISELDDTIRSKLINKLCIKGSAIPFNHPAANPITICATGEQITTKIEEYVPIKFVTKSLDVGDQVIILKVPGLPFLEGSRAELLSRPEPVADLGVENLTRVRVKIFLDKGETRNYTLINARLQAFTEKCKDKKEKEFQNEIVFEGRNRMTKQDERLNNVYQVNVPEGNVLFDFPKVQKHKFTDPAFAKDAYVETWKDNGDFIPTKGMKGKLKEAFNDSQGRETFVLQIELGNGKIHNLSILAAGVELVEKAKKEAAESEVAQTRTLVTDAAANSETTRNNIKKVFAEAGAKTNSVGTAVAVVAAASTTANGKAETTMEKTKTQKAIDTVKSDLKKGSIRTAARQACKLFSEPLAAFLESKLGGDKSKVAEFMKSEFGKGMISYVLGITLAQIPLTSAKQKEFLEALAEELRLQGVDMSLNEVMESFMGPIRQIISLYAGSSSSEESEEEEEQTSTATATATLDAVR